jgi:ribosome-associated translation inhibitor RaiA
MNCTDAYREALTRAASSAAWQSSSVSDAENGSTPFLPQRLCLGSGFGDADRSHVLELLSSLERHLVRWDPEQVDLEISVKDRGGSEQKVTFEAGLPTRPPLVASAAAADLDHAVIEVRQEMIRQIEDEKAKRGPRERSRSSSRTA